MNDRAATLIVSLGLAPHPEGGHYRETFRSRRMVQTDDGRGERWAMTAIHYLLRAGEIARWHRVASDETWHWYEGDALELLLLDPALTRSYRCALGPVAAGQLPSRSVPAGWWQCARPLGAYTLAGCTVAPGFEFTDHLMLSARPALSERLRAEHPEFAEYL